MYFRSFHVYIITNEVKYIIITKIIHLKCLRNFLNHTSDNCHNIMISSFILRTFSWRYNWVNWSCDSLLGRGVNPKLHYFVTSLYSITFQRFYSELIIYPCWPLYQFCKTPNWTSVLGHTLWFLVDWVRIPAIGYSSECLSTTYI